MRGGFGWTKGAHWNRASEHLLDLKQRLDHVESYLRNGDCLAAANGLQEALEVAGELACQEAGAGSVRNPQFLEARVKQRVRLARLWDGFRRGCVKR